MASPVGSVATSNGYAAFNGIGNHSYHTGIDLPGINEKTVVYPAATGTVVEVVGLADAAECKESPCTEEKELENIRIWDDTNGNKEVDVDKGDLLELKPTPRQFQDNHGYGISVVIYHSDRNVYTQYSHLSAVKKEIWDAMTQAAGSVYVVIPG